MSKAKSRSAAPSSAVASPVLPKAEAKQDSAIDLLTRGRKERADRPAPSNFLPTPVKEHFGSHYHDAITRAMAAITEYLIPDSGKSAEEAVADVLAILDHRDLVRALRARPMNDCVPNAGMQIHEALNDTWETLDAEAAASIRQEGVRDAIAGIIEYDGLHYDGWLAAEPKLA